MFNKIKSFFKNTKILLIILLASFIINVLLLSLCLFISNNDSQKINKLQSNLNATQEKTSATNQLKEVSKRYNLKMYKKGGEFFLYFTDKENATYNEIVYQINEDRFKILDVNLKNKNIRAEAQKSLVDYSKFLNFVYEDWSIGNLNTLSTEISQSDGNYPATIYNGYYQIFTNKYKIKFKKTCHLLPGYLEYKIETVSGGNTYYNFTATYNVLDTDFDKASFFKDPFVWIKKYPQKQFLELDSFVESLSTYPPS